MVDSKQLLQNIAAGSFSKVIEQNNKMIFIETRTEKVKNVILRQFVEQALQDGYTHENLIEVLIEMDLAVETNDVRKTLKQYL